MVQRKNKFNDTFMLFKFELCEWKNEKFDLCTALYLKQVLLQFFSEISLWSLFNLTFKLIKSQSQIKNSETLVLKYKRISYKRNLAL